MRRPDDPEVAEWLAKAAEDLRVARLLLDSGEPLHAPACFHCQQVAEKSIKALMVASEIRPPRSHDLVALLADLEGLGLPDDVGEAAAFLTQFAVLPRYPGVTMGQERLEAELAYARADVVCRSTLDRLADG